MLSDGPESRDMRWKWALLALCGLSLLGTFAYAADMIGLGSRPWFGWWDANAVATGQPYTVAVAQPRPGGASARDGLRDGDRIDLREQSLGARVAVLYQPMATRPTMLKIHRGSSTLAVSVTGSTAWEGEPLWKVPNHLVLVLASLWFIACAFLIASRRWLSRDARMLALVLIALASAGLYDPSAFVVPVGTLALALLVFARFCAAGAALLLVRLSSQFGIRSMWRTNVERLAYATILLGFVADLAAAVSVLTLWIDPLPYIFRISTLRGGVAVVAGLFVVVVATIAVVKTPPGERPRSAWLLLPLPIALLTSVGVATLALVIHSWFANIAVVAVSDALLLFGALVVTFALLKRRVLDFEFVLSRALVVATVSLIVVASFVLLEWILGTVLAGLSHATGLIANGALALLLGLSLNVIHKRVDAVVDGVLFRKRHADERALLEFSKETAYVTQPGALLDQTIEKVKRHTDARGAAVLLDGSGFYEVARSFGDGIPPAIGENDGAILALKTWHKPLDPHHYTTSLRGALAFPMVARARLLGVLLVGERAGGEAYAPDEVEALSQLAHGVGSALDALALRHDDRIVALVDAVRALPDAIVERLNAATAEGHS